MATTNTAQDIAGQGMNPPIPTDGLLEIEAGTGDLNTSFSERQAVTTAEKLSLALDLLKPFGTLTREMLNDDTFRVKQFNPNFSNSANKAFADLKRSLSIISEVVDRGQEARNGNLELIDGLIENLIAKNRLLELMKSPGKEKEGVDNKTLMYIFKLSPEETAEELSNRGAAATVQKHTSDSAAGEESTGAAPGSGGNPEPGHPGKADEKKPEATAGDLAKTDPPNHAPVEIEPGNPPNPPPGVTTDPGPGPNFDAGWSVKTDKGRVYLVWEAPLEPREKTAWKSVAFEIGREGQQEVAARLSELSILARGNGSMAGALDSDLFANLAETQRLALMRGINLGERVILNLELAAGSVVHDVTLEAGGVLALQRGSVERAGRLAADVSYPVTLSGIHAKAGSSLILECAGPNTSVFNLLVEKSASLSGNLSGSKGWDQSGRQSEIHGYAVDMDFRGSALAALARSNVELFRKNFKSMLFRLESLGGADLAQKSYRVLTNQQYEQTCYDINTGSGEYKEFGPNQLKSVLSRWPQPLQHDASAKSPEGWPYFDRTVEANKYQLRTAPAPTLAQPACTLVWSYQERPGGSLDEKSRIELLTYQSAIYQLALVEMRLSRYQYRGPDGGGGAGEAPVPFVGPIAGGAKPDDKKRRAAIPLRRPNVAGGAAMQLDEESSIAQVV